MTHTPAAQPCTPRKKKGLGVEKPTRFRPHLGRAVNRTVRACRMCAPWELPHSGGSWTLPAVKEESRKGEKLRTPSLKKRGERFSKQLLQRTFYIYFKETFEFKWHCQSFLFSNMTMLFYPYLLLLPWWKWGGSYFLHLREHLARASNLNALFSMFFFI